MLVGGSLVDLNENFTKLSLQNQVEKLSSDLELVTNADLYVVARGQDCTLEWSGEDHASSEPYRLTSSLFFKICILEPQFSTDRMG